MISNERREAILEKLKADLEKEDMPKRSISHLQPGDRAIRYILGIIPMEVTVVSNDSKIVKCGNLMSQWFFNANTGWEIDDIMGWDGLNESGSYLKEK